MFLILVGLSCHPLSVRPWLDRETGARIDVSAPAGSNLSGPRTVTIRVSNPLPTPLFLVWPSFPSNQLSIDSRDHDSIVTATETSQSLIIREIPATTGHAAYTGILDFVHVMRVMGIAPMSTVSVEDSVWVSNQDPHVDLCVAHAIRVDGWPQAQEVLDGHLSPIATDVVARPTYSGELVSAPVGPSVVLIDADCHSFPVPLMRRRS